MPRRPGLTREAVVDAAAELLDAEGEEALSLAALANRLGVRPPSLYNHVAGIEGLRRELRLLAVRRLGDATRGAAMGRAGADALRAVARAYRAFALAHPGPYLLTLRTTEGSDEELRAAGDAVVDAVVAVLEGYGLEGEEALHGTRALRSALHGFVALELAGGFGREAATEASFERLLDLIDRGLRATSRPREA